jgi:hypothetical protein
VQATATAKKMAMTIVMRVMGNKEGNCNIDEGGRQAAATRAMTTAMATMTRLVGNKEGKGKDSKSNGDGNEGGRQ